jgi:hypothetical protein
MWYVGLDVHAETTTSRRTRTPLELRTEIAADATSLASASHAIGSVALRNLSSGEASATAEASVCPPELTIAASGATSISSHRVRLRAGGDESCIPRFANCDGSRYGRRKPHNARSAVKLSSAWESSQHSKKLTLKAVNVCANSIEFMQRTSNLRPVYLGARAIWTDIAGNRLALINLESGECIDVN